MYSVYKVTNLVNNKIYIGITTLDVAKRWYQHCSDAYAKRDNYVFHKAIRKYGSTNFKVEIIDTANSEEELKQKEIYYISFYHSYILDKDCNGYNMTPGGDLNTNLYGELSPVSKNTDSQRYEIIDMLQHTTYSYLQIAEKVKIDSIQPGLYVKNINYGETFWQKDLSYPIRKDNRSISKRGENNPSSIGREKALAIIDMLEHTHYTQEFIAEQEKVHYNTVSNINNCKVWTELHNYKHNIRKECGQTVHSIAEEEKVKQIIHLLEEGRSNREIQSSLHTSLNFITDINLCRKYTYLHSYHQNIRKESKNNNAN